MLRVMRTMQVRICESYSAFWKWGHEYTEYMNEKFPETKLFFFVRGTGQMHLACWMSDHEDLAAYERWRNATWADEGRGELLRTAPMDAIVDTSDTIHMFETR